MLVTEAAIIRRGRATLNKAVLGGGGSLRVVVWELRARSMSLATACFQSNCFCSYTNHGVLKLLGRNRAGSGHRYLLGDFTKRFTATSRDRYNVNRYNAVVY
jgi:hypothetical protein